jgi:CIC family chloride channel protein
MIWWTILTPTIGGLLSGALLHYVVPGARGSGIPQVKVAYAIKGGRVPFRDAIGKFLIGVLQIGTGSSLGREGRTVQICAGVASTHSRERTFDDRRREILAHVVS